MTEAEWLAISNPGDLIPRSRPGLRLSTRKIRLLTCACLRRAWHLLSEEGQRCVETVEDFADGKVSKQQLEAARVLYVRGGNQADNGAYYAASPVAQFRSFAISALSHARLAVGEQGFSVTLQPVDWERARQLELARDILGNPFRPATIDPS